MENDRPPIANLTIDLRRNRFRIYRKTLRYLGNPEFIQFLINPEELYIAILGSDKPIAGGTANRINLNLSLNCCVDFYSAALMNGIFSIFGVLEHGCSYHLVGEIDQTNRVAYYSLKTLKKIERGAVDDRKGV